MRTCRTGVLQAAFFSSWSPMLTLQSSRKKVVCGKMIEGICREEVAAGSGKDGYSGVPLVQDFASLYAQEEARVRLTYLVSLRTELPGSSADVSELKAQRLSLRRHTTACSVVQTRYAAASNFHGQVRSSTQTDADKDRHRQRERERERVWSW